MTADIFYKCRYYKNIFDVDKEELNKVSFVLERIKQKRKINDILIRPKRIRLTTDF